MSRIVKAVAAAVLLLVSIGAAAQDAKPAPPMSSTQRLTQAKTVFIKHGAGSEIPYNVASDIIEGWGRFTIVSSPEKADIVLEVSAPDTGSGVSVSSSTSSSTDPRASTTTTSRQLSNAPVKMIVYDAKSKLPLWSATEQPKFSMKQKGREDGLVEASQRLMAKFRDRVEPSLAK